MNQLEKSYSLRLPSLFVTILSLAMIGLVVQTTRGGARDQALKTACMKKLTDLYQSSEVYAQTSLDEGGGDGIYPYKANAQGPQDILMTMVQAGIIVEPKILKCPAGDGPVAKGNPKFDSKRKRPWSPGQSPFQLTDATTYYGFSKSKVFSDSGNPHLALAGDRWIRNSKKGALSNNHRGGRNFLLATGRVRWAKEGSGAHKKYFNQLLVKVKNPEKFKKAQKKWQAAKKAKEEAREKEKAERKEAREFFEKNYDTKIVEIGKKIYLGVVYGKFDKKNRWKAQEISAIGTLRTLFSSQQQFRILRKDGRNYATLEALGKAELIDKKLASGKKSGYQFKIKLSPDKQSFEITALPLNPLPTRESEENLRAFHIDNQGTIRYTKDGSTPTAQSPRLPSNYGAGPKRHYNLSLTKAIKKAPARLKKDWNNRLDILSGKDKKKRKLFALGARVAVIIEVKKKLAQNYYELSLVMEKILDNPSLRDDKSFQKKVKEMVGKIAPIARALFGRPKRGGEIKIVRKLTTTYLAEKKAQKVLEVINRLEKERQKRPKKYSKGANETSAIGSVRTIFSAQQQYRTLRKDGRNYAKSLKELGRHNLIDKSLASGEKNGYKFEMTRAKDGQSFELVAMPLSKEKGVRSFFVDESGAITYTSDGSRPDENSPVLD